MKDILKALMQSTDRINYMVLLPQAFEQLKNNDFETASSVSIQPLKLYYVFNVVTRSLGLVLYHNDMGYCGGYTDNLQEEWNLVVPSSNMLAIALKLDEVHTFGDMSKSQLFEKMGWLIEKAITEDKKS